MDQSPSIFFNQWNINDEMSDVLAGAANMALARNTWSNYTTVENHINRCSLKLNSDLSFLWDIEKTLKFIGYLKTDRNCAAKTIDCYLSAVRMSHLSRGIDSPHLRQPIVKMIIKGFAHSDALKSKLEKKLGRFPVTVPVLKYIKRKLEKINWPIEKRQRVWAVATLLWGGSLRCHEALSRECKEYDETTTLLFEDVKFCDAKIDGKWEKLLKIKLKCPKESSVGNGVVIEVFRNDTFLCATKALKKYLKNHYSEHPMGLIIQADSLTRIWLKSLLILLMAPRVLSDHTLLELVWPVKWDCVVSVMIKSWLLEDGRLWRSKFIANYLGQRE